MSEFSEWMAGRLSAKGFWVLTSLSHPEFHQQGVIDPCGELWMLWDGSLEAARKACPNIPDDAELEVRKYSPPPGWREEDNDG